MATAKRARQIIDGDKPLATAKCQKPFSVAVEELYEGKVKVIGDGEEDLEFDDEEELFENTAAEEAVEEEALPEETEEEV